MKTTKKRTLSESQKRELLLNKLRQIIREEIEREELNEISWAGIKKGFKKAFGLDDDEEDVDKTQEIDMSKVRFKTNTGIDTSLTQSEIQDLGPWKFVVAGLISSESVTYSKLADQLNKWENKINVFRDDLFKIKKIPYSKTKFLLSINDIIKNLNQILNLSKRKWDLFSMIFTNQNLIQIKTAIINNIILILKVCEKVGGDIRFFSKEIIEKELPKIETIIQNGIEGNRARESSNTQNTFDDIKKKINDLIKESKKIKNKKLIRK